MIADARPLQPDFVPGDVRHREGETDALTSTLEPILDGTHAEPVLLHGPSGTGKTCIARYAVDRLRKEVVDLHTQYVNCWQDYTRYKTVYRLLEGIDSAFDVHRTWELGELVCRSSPRRTSPRRSSEAFQHPMNPENQ